MLSEQNADDIAALARKCDDVSRILVDLRDAMTKQGPGTLEINYLKADGFLDYLLDWAKACKRKHSRIRGQQAALRAREELKRKRGLS